MKNQFLIIAAIIFLVISFKPGSNNNSIKINQTNCDSLKLRLQNLEKWYKQQTANYDSTISFAFYASKYHLETLKKLNKYQPVLKAELLICELNDLMFSGGDPVHNFSNFANLGEVGHFFEETKKELDKLKVKYTWDQKKMRYVLENKK